MLHQYAGRKFIFATKVNEVHHPFARPSRIHDMPPSQQEPVWFSTQVVIFAFNGFQFNQNALGESKKRPNVPRVWPNLTTSVAFESTAQRTRGTMALTGKVSGIPSELFAPARAPQQRLREGGEQPTAAPPSTAPSCTDITGLEPKQFALDRVSRWQHDNY